jgi:hypothetical protein
MVVVCEKMMRHLSKDLKTPWNISLSVADYDYRTCPLTLRVEHRLRALQKQAMPKTCGRPGYVNNLEPLQTDIL